MNNEDFLTNRENCEENIDPNSMFKNSGFNEQKTLLIIANDPASNSLEESRFEATDESGGEVFEQPLSTVGDCDRELTTNSNFLNKYVCEKCSTKHAKTYAHQNVQAKPKNFTRKIQVSSIFNKKTVST